MRNDLIVRVPLIQVKIRVKSLLAVSSGWQTPLRVISCGGLRTLGVTEWAEGALKQRASQSHSQLMLSESERSYHVFWQLTRLVWILQHKARTEKQRVCVCVWVCASMCVNLCFCTFAGKCARGIFFALTLLPLTVKSLPQNLLSLTF